MAIELLGAPLATATLPDAPMTLRSPLLLLTLALMAATGLMVRSSIAAYTSSGSASASFSSASCFSRATTQNGTATSSANGTTTVTISNVDPAKAFLLFSTRHSSNRPVASSLRGRLASGTSLEFVRVTDESSPVAMTIEWSVVEYACGMSVQRGATVPISTSVDVTISPVPAVDQAFVTWSKTVDAGDGIFGNNDLTIVDLASTTTLSVRVESADSNHLIWWQVVSFTDPATIGVQRGTTALSAGTASITATITAVDPAKAFLLVSSQSPSNDLGSVLVRGRITAATTVTLDRGASNAAVTEIAWQVVELLDGSSVQSGSASFGVGVATVSTTITTVSVTRSSAFASAHTGGGQNGGRTPYTADDVVGVAAATVELFSPSQVTLARNSTVATADIAWFVVSWGRP